ncbi:MAG TPA: hypothetical protein VFU47_13055 [Armatimonadota bacterium]|nr:hypothetical protein [Armatimonadota bacterium]
MTARALRRVPVLALLGGLLAALPARADDPGAILLKSLEPNKSYYGEQVSTVTLPGAPGKRSSRQEVYRSGSTLRINFPNGRVIFDDGKEQLIYAPRPNVVEKRPSQFAPQRLQAQRRAIRSRRVTVKQLPDGTVAGRGAYVVSVALPSGMNRTLWVDKETSIQLRLDETAPKGRSVSTYFTRITVGEPPAAMLTFTPPAGAQVVERLEGRPLPPARVALRARAWGGLLRPQFVPSGYVLRGHYPHAFQGRQGLVSVYDGPGKKTLSIFQGPALGMGSMAEHKGNHLQVVSAPRGNAVVTVVGPEGEDLQRVVDSMTPAP